MATTPANPTLPGWGVDKSITQLPNNIITDWETSKEGQFGYVQDNKGRVVHREHYDTKTTITATVLFRTTENVADSIDVDSALTVDGETFKVLSVREIQSNTDKQKLTIVFERYTNWPQSGGDNGNS